MTTFLLHFGIYNKYNNDIKLMPFGNPVVVLLCRDKTLIP